MLRAICAFGLVASASCAALAQVPASTPPLAPVFHPGQQTNGLNLAITVRAAVRTVLTSSATAASTVSLTGTGITMGVNDLAVFVGEPDNPRSFIQVAQTGSILPGLASGVVLTNLTGAGVAFSNFFVDDTGAVGFTSGLSGPGVTTTNDVAFFQSAGGVPSLVLREGDQAVGQTTGVTISSINLALGNAGLYSVNANLTGPFVVPATDTISIIGSINGGPIFVLREGDALPGIPEGFASQGAIGIDRGGRFYVPFKYSSLLVGSDRDDALVVYSEAAPSTPAIWFREGEQVPGLPPGVVTLASDSFIYNFANNRFNLRIGLAGPGVSAANDSVFLVGGPSSLGVVFREGDQAPGLPAGVTMSAIQSSASMNDEGTMVFQCSLAGTGVTTANDLALFRYRNGVLSLLIREGDQMADLPAGVTFAGLLSGLALASDPEPFAAGVANLAGAGVSGSNNAAMLVVRPDGAIRSFARRGTPLPFGTGLANVTNLGVVNGNGTLGLPAHITGQGQLSVLFSTSQGVASSIADLSDQAEYAAWRVPLPNESNTNQGVNGTEFEPTVDIEVTHLGYFDDTRISPPGLAAEHPVAIYPLLGSGTPAIATATIPAGTGTPVGNYFRFVPLNPPVRLRGGQNYAIVGVSGGDFGHNVAASSIAESQHIVLGGWRTGPTIDTLAYPATVLNTTARFMGPTFKYRVAGARCVADVDDGSGSGTPDGGVTIEDLLFYLVLFGNGDVRADVDDGTNTGTPDGGVTIEDLLYYLVRFENGC